MGGPMTLPLYGTAAFSRGVSADTPSTVVRLRSPWGLPAASAADFALVRSKEDLGAAHASCSGVLIVGDDSLEQLPEAAAWARLIRVPSRFDYFADGDVLGFQPDSGKFRTLYRRASKHN